MRIRVKEAHRDARVFEDPHTFNPDRFADRKYSHEEYCPFGAFEHACLGIAMTHAVGRLLITTWASEFAIHAIDDGPLEASPWRIWRPNSRFRVHVEPLTAPSDLEEGSNLQNAQVRI